MEGRLDCDFYYDTLNLFVTKHCDCVEFRVFVKVLMHILFQDLMFTNVFFFLILFLTSLMAEFFKITRRASLPFI